MHSIQEQLLKLSKKENLAKLSLRDMAENIGHPEYSAQQIKHHLLQLQKKGFVTINRARGVMGLTLSKPGWARGLLNKKSAKLFSIPIIGKANCGPDTIFAEPNFQGFLRISNKLINRQRPDGLFAVKADGASMNRAEINEKTIDSYKRFLSRLESIHRQSTKHNLQGRCPFPACRNTPR